MRVELLRHLAAALVVLVLIAVFAAVGSPGATYRANAAYAACVADAPTAMDEEVLAIWSECGATHCPDAEPSRVASLGLWLHGQLDPDGPACQAPPELLDILLP